MDTHLDLHILRYHLVTCEAGPREVDATFALRRDPTPAIKLHGNLQGAFADAHRTSWKKNIPHNTRDFLL